jgi:hypothetical protein
MLSRSKAFIRFCLPFFGIKLALWNTTCKWVADLTIISFYSSHIAAGFVKVPLLLHYYVILFRWYFSAFSSNILILPVSHYPIHLHRSCFQMHRSSWHSAPTHSYYRNIFELIESLYFRA